MHKTMHTKKSSQTLHYKLNKNVTDDKNTEVENVKHGVYNFLAVCQNSDKVVGFCKNNTFKKFRKNMFKKIKKLLKQGEQFVLLSLEVYNFFKVQVLQYYNMKRQIY